MASTYLPIPNRVDPTVKPYGVREPRKRVVRALSGYGAELDVQRSKDAGFQLHLVKPMTYEQMSEVLAAATRFDGVAGLQRNAEGA